MHMYEILDKYILCNTTQLRKKFENSKFIMKKDLFEYIRAAVMFDKIFRTISSFLNFLYLMP